MVSLLHVVWSGAEQEFSAYLHASEPVICHNVEMVAMNSELGGEGKGKVSGTIKYYIICHNIQECSATYNIQEFKNILL